MTKILFKSFFAFFLYGIIGITILFLCILLISVKGNVDEPAKFALGFFWGDNNINMKLPTNLVIPIFIGLGLPSGILLFLDRLKLDPNNILKWILIGISALLVLIAFMILNSFQEGIHKLDIIGSIIIGIPIGFGSVLAGLIETFFLNDYIPKGLGIRIE